MCFFSLALGWLGPPGQAGDWGRRGWEEKVVLPLDLRGLPLPLIDLDTCLVVSVQEWA